MKRACLLIWGVLFTSIAWSQSMNIHYKNGSAVQYNMQDIDYIEFADNNQNVPQVSSGEAIDLGLSVKWASCNLGASSPEIFGDRYAWGEVETKSSFTKSNYLYYDSYTMSYIDLGWDIGGTNYDVAYVKLGGSWRLPTKDEYLELARNCDREWTMVNGRNGYKYTSTINGNSIFFPVGENSIWLWTSQRDAQGGGKDAIGHWIRYGDISNIGHGREKGSYVRAVKP